MSNESERSNFTVWNRRRKREILMKKILYKQFIQKIFLFGLLAIVLGGALSVSAQKRTANSKTVKTNSPVSAKSKTLASEPSNPIMAGVWESGELPLPLPMPAGRADEIAAILALKGRRANGRINSRAADRSAVSRIFYHESGRLGFSRSNGQ